MTTAAFDQRNRQVLLAVIAEYVETGEPVGSRAVARRHIQGLSPATIRNAMADLEEVGYLVQPHTSAGRVPTDAAYRFYVDHLQRVPWVAGKAPSTAAPAVPHADAAERLMAETPSRLSSDTHARAHVAILAQKNGSPDILFAGGTLAWVNSGRETVMGDQPA